MPTVLLSNMPARKDPVNLFLSIMLWISQMFLVSLQNCICGKDCEKEVEGGEIPDSMSSTLKFVDQASFPNIFTILHILATISVTSCSGERSVSSLWQLKNYLRSTMRQTRSNGLALIHAH